LLSSDNPDAALINISLAEQIEFKAVQEPDVVDLIALPSSIHFLHFASPKLLVSNPLLEL